MERTDFLNYYVHESDERKDTVLCVMNCFCSTRPRLLSKKFTVLLMHVVAATPKSALRYSSRSRLN